MGSIRIVFIPRVEQLILSSKRLKSNGCMQGSHLVLPSLVHSWASRQPFSTCLRKSSSLSSAICVLCLWFAPSSYKKTSHACTRCSACPAKGAKLNWPNSWPKMLLRGLCSVGCGLWRLCLSHVCGILVGTTQLTFTAAFHILFLSCIQTSHHTWSAIFFTHTSPSLSLCNSEMDW